MTHRPIPSGRPPATRHDRRDRTVFVASSEAGERVSIDPATMIASVCSKPPSERAMAAEFAAACIGGSLWWFRSVPDAAPVEWMLGAELAEELLARGDAEAAAVCSVFASCLRGPVGEAVTDAAVELAQRGVGVAEWADQCSSWLSGHGAELRGLDLDSFVIEMHLAGDRCAHRIVSSLTRDVPPLLCLAALLQPTPSFEQVAKDLTVITGAEWQPIEPREALRRVASATASMMRVGGVPADHTSAVAGVLVLGRARRLGLGIDLPPGPNA